MGRQVVNKVKERSGTTQMTGFRVVMKPISYVRSYVVSYPQLANIPLQDLNIHACICSYTNGVSNIKSPPPI